MGQTIDEDLTRLFISPCQGKTKQPAKQLLKESWSSPATVCHSRDLIPAQFCINQA